MTTNQDGLTTRDASRGSGRIVVGADGSEHSKVALAWAARQASLTGDSLTVITTWAFPTSYGAVVEWPADLDFAADAKSVLDDSIAAVLGPDPGEHVTSAVIEGHAALVLEEESKSATLLVVGSRGHGEFTGMLLGSVSEFLATHAHCPLVIIRGDGESPAST